MRGFLTLLFFGWMSGFAGAQTSVVKYFASTDAVSHRADTLGFEVVHRFYNRKGDEVLKLPQSLMAGEKVVVQYYDDGGMERVALLSNGQNNLGPPSEARFGFDELQRMLYQEMFYINEVTTRIEYHYDAEGRRSESILCNPPRGW